MNKCVKCGSVDINVRYIVKENREYLAKKCNRCEYLWAEDCLDKKDKK